ncbi:MAG: AAA family ATPase [Planctomycetaceae bacterium]|nr:AAA family ATPase [Planctomycetaceae bacterium]
MNRKMLALYGLEWNPFAPDVPVEALHVGRRIESFCWRAEQLVGEGGFALITGAPGAGKSVTLRILADRLEARREAKVGVISRPQSGLSDFYREMGDLFGVELSPHNRWAGAKVLRDRWQAHIDAALSRPVLLADEAQEMKAAVLAELRLLSSARFDSHVLLTVVLAGDGRLLQRLRSDELAALDSRCRVRLALERATPDELAELLAHALQEAGAARLMTPELIATLADHAQGNPRALMNMAAELLDAAAQREAPHIDEKLFLEMCAAPPHPEARPARRPGDGPLTSMLPVEPAWRLAERADEHRWLVAGLWSDEAVGIVGGEPKCCKSLLALDLAVSVASGAPCLRRFDVLKAGRVLLYAAEDALHVVRRRLDGIAAAAGARLADLDIQVIVAPTLRLDLEVDRRNLAETVDRLRPRLLILDPFVRLHRIDENASGEVAPLLAWLRELQRRYGVAVLVVHHARKGGACLRAGQALRGSSEFHAWGDSNLYLRRDGEELTLTAEHRAAPSSRPLVVELVQNGPALALEAVERARPVAVNTPSLDERVMAALAEAREPLPFADLRARCRVRAATLHERVGLLAAAGRIVKTADGYRLADP